jgi:hypothetical protein
MEIFSHFDDVFIQYYNIIVLHFYYHTFTIALSGILYQECPKNYEGWYFLNIQTNPHQDNINNNNHNVM